MRAAKGKTGFTEAHAQRLYDIQAAEWAGAARRLKLAVGVANGAGMTVVAARIVDSLGTGMTPEMQGVVAMLFPSAVIFGIGTALIGAALVWDILDTNDRLRSAAAMLIDIRNGESYAAEASPLDLKTFIRMFGLETAAGIAFLVGSALPLITLLQRHYSHASGFAW